MILKAHMAMKKQRILRTLRKINTPSGPFNYN